MYCDVSHSILIDFPF